MDNEDRLKSEKDFHNETFSKNTRSAVKKYYKSASESKSKYKSLIIDNIEGAKVLEYGCGPGSSAFDLAEKGAKVTAIDISDVAINLAREKAVQENLDIDFFVMDAEELEFEEEYFDLICGSGILHHLDLSRAYRQISRTLKPNGRAVFFEPLGHNPIINIYRSLTPKLRTVDEHPLLMKDLLLAEKYFNHIESHFFNLTLMAASFFPFLSKPLKMFDKWLFSCFPRLKKHAWIVVLEFSDPIK